MVPHSATNATRHVSSAVPRALSESAQRPRPALASSRNISPAGCGAAKHDANGDAWSSRWRTRDDPFDAALCCHPGADLCPAMLVAFMPLNAAAVLKIAANRFLERQRHW